MAWPYYAERYLYDDRQQRMSIGLPPDSALPSLPAESAEEKEQWKTFWSAPAPAYPRPQPPFRCVLPDRCAPWNLAAITALDFLSDPHLGQSKLSETEFTARAMEVYLSLFRWAEEWDQRHNDHFYIPTWTVPGNQALFTEAAIRAAFDAHPEVHTYKLDMVKYLCEDTCNILLMYVETTTMRIEHEERQIGLPWWICTD